MPTKVHRQRLVERLIAAGDVHSQEQLVDLLSERGVEATQATISRDLHDLGVMKGPGGYTLPASAPGGAAAPRRAIEALREAVEAHLLDAQPAGTLTVVRTAPGHAQALAAAIDAAGEEGMPGVAGTIAGDDCIFLATASLNAAKAVARRLRSTSGLD